MKYQDNVLVNGSSFTKTLKPDSFRIFFCANNWVKKYEWPRSNKAKDQDSTDYVKLWHSRDLKRYTKETKKMPTHLLVD